MLHHVSLGTADLDRARSFYDPVMDALGLRRTFDADDAVGYGAGVTVFSLNLPADGGRATVGNGTHIAFEVERRSAVDAFFDVAVANGGVANGAPGLRAHYDAHYYAAFVPRWQQDRGADLRSGLTQPAATRRRQSIR